MFLFILLLAALGVALFITRKHMAESARMYQSWRRAAWSEINEYIHCLELSNASDNDHEKDYLDALAEEAAESARFYLKHAGSARNDIPEFLWKHFGVSSD